MNNQTEMPVRKTKKTAKQEVEEQTEEPVLEQSHTEEPADTETIGREEEVHPEEENKTEEQQTVAENSEQPRDDSGYGYQQEYQQDYQQGYQKDYQQDYQQNYQQDYQQNYQQDYQQDYRQDYRSGPRNNTVAVFGLPSHTEENEIRAAFSSFGDIRELRMIRDHHTDNFKGFAFVTFFDCGAATKAKEQLEGFLIAGAPIRLDFSKPARRRGFVNRGFGRGFRDNRYRFGGYDNRFDRRQRPDYNRFPYDRRNDGYGKRSKTDNTQNWENDSRGLRARRYNDDGDHRYRRY